MHELGLCDAIVAAGLRRAKGRRVSGLRVRAAAPPVDPDVIDQGFALAAAGTLLEGAALELIVEPVSARCRRCGNRAAAHTALALAACPACGGVDVEVPGEGGVEVETITFTAPRQEEKTQAT